MNTGELLNLLAALGAGGAVGAIAAMYVAAIGLKERFAAFAADLRGYLGTREDPLGKALLEDLRDIESRIAQMNNLAARLGRALKRR